MVARNLRQVDDHPLLDGSESCALARGQRTPPLVQIIYRPQKLLHLHWLARFRIDDAHAKVSPAGLGQALFGLKVDVAKHAPLLLSVLIHWVLALCRP